LRNGAHQSKIAAEHELKTKWKMDKINEYGINKYIAFDFVCSSILPTQPLAARRS